MPLQLYAHPFSSYCQKVLIALYENDVGFDFRRLSPQTPEVGAAFDALWPIKRFPLLVDGDAARLRGSIARTGPCLGAAPGRRRLAVGPFGSRERRADCPRAGPA